MLFKKQRDLERSEYLVRKADPSDARGIIACMQSVMDERIYLVGEYYLLTERGEQERIRSVEDLTLVTDRYSEIVGVLTIQRGMYKKNRHTANLGIAVKAGHRKKGLGTRMISEAINWCRAQGVKKLNLEVFSSNIGAIKAYEKAGFEIEGYRRGQFIINGEPVDDVLMTYYPQA